MDVEQVNACRDRFSQSWEKHGDTILGKYGNEINFYSLQTLPVILDPPGYCFVLNGGI